MKSNLSLLTVFIGAGLFILPSVTYAGTLNLCRNAQTTADLVECSHQELEQANGRLDKLYDALLAVYESDSKIMTHLFNNQKQWIDFRNDTCSLVSEESSGGSLQRVQEIRCFVRMTEERSDHFQDMLAGLDTKNVPEFSSPPRWVNVLGQDYKDVFWAISSRQTADPDCDGVNEVIIRGVRENTKKEGYDTIIAIADSAATGRPKISLLTFDDEKNCEVLPDISVTPMPVSKPSEDDKGNQCREQITLRTKNCGPFVIGLDQQSDSYTLSAPNK